MTPRNYHTPPPSISNRVRCPVCHEAVYSRAGIHPQCAVRQSDPPKGKAKPKDVAIDGVAVVDGLPTDTLIASLPTAELV